MAFYNTGYPASYQPLYQYPAMQPSQPTGQSVNQGGLIWVQGEAGAKSYLVAPNCTVQLWDSEAQVVYLKSADASGMPSMKVLDYTIRNSAQNPACNVVENQEGVNTRYATKNEIKAVFERINAIQEQVDSLTAKKEGK